MTGLATSTVMGLPGLELQFVVGLLLQYFFCSLRIGAFLLSAPLFGARWMPLPVRIMMALVLGSIVAVQFPSITISQLTTAQTVMAVFNELAIGLTAGLILSILFAAILLAGEKIASTAGLGFAAQVDPQTGGQTPVVSQTLYLFLLVLFLSLDGHLIALATIYKSYELIPIGSVIKPEAMVQAGIDAGGAMFLAAAIIMLPIAIILLLINVSIGIITKSAPQLNLFSFGFPISLLAVFFALYISVGSLGNSMRWLIDDSLETVEMMIVEVGNGGR
ncbi:flagellar biosynthetic protein FliR [Alphaproteobacteria bacterium]|jgi:flagellar biosynthetic protein FliR|nr:flagellar biosynthetic protein FliR [Alphaproteobacteria bacterium]MDB3892277.1 flagellar biosynthetic protein FliR [Alphaproteobacteria bacterium]